MRHTKIVCTLGPASSDIRLLRRLVRAGMDAARFNFSHGSHREHTELLRKLRQCASQADRPVAVIQDLSGPKLRIGEITGTSINLKAGREIVLTTLPVPGDHERLSVNYEGLPQELRRGDTLLLADGMIELRVKEVSQNEIICRVIIGGTLSSRKGLSILNRSLNLPSFTEKDRRDLLWGINHRVDFVALSYVKSPDDLARVRSFLDKHGARIPLIAKIETREALDNLEAVIQAADVVMVARGDLGVNVPLESVPGLQKDIIRRSALLGRPVITATQMLRSMVTNPRPTRAEVTDVANAVLDGADATMLSEETAMGRYPVRATQMMSRIIVEAERIFSHPLWLQTLADIPQTLSAAVAGAACRLATETNAAAIVACTCTGRTAINVARLRPAVPIFAATPNRNTFQRLSIVRGLFPVRIPKARSDEKLLQDLHHYLMDKHLVQPGDRLVVLAGFPLGVPGATNFLRVITAGTL